MGFFARSTLLLLQSLTMRVNLSGSGSTPKVASFMVNSTGANTFKYSVLYGEVWGSANTNVGSITTSWTGSTLAFTSSFYCVDGNYSVDCSGCSSVLVIPVTTASATSLLGGVNTIYATGVNMNYTQVNVTNANPTVPFQIF